MGASPGPLADALDVHYGSISRIYGNASLQTSQLEKISRHLKYDFFAVYSANLGLKSLLLGDSEIKKPESEVLLDEKIAEIAVLKGEIAALKLEGMQKENGYLKQINGLLLKK